MWSILRAAPLAPRPPWRSRFAVSRTDMPYTSQENLPMHAGLMGRWLLGLSAIGLASACGGQFEMKGDGGAGDDAAELVGFSDAAGPAPTTVVDGAPDRATTGSVPTVDAAPPTAHDAASPACTPMGTGGGGGKGQCSSTFQEICGGTIYQASCSCPRGSCVCFGQSTTVVNFTSCPSCPGLDPSAGPTTADIFELCAFPQ
jgi:hypothetical protein